MDITLKKFILTRMITAIKKLACHAKVPSSILGAPAKMSIMKQLDAM